MQKQKDCKWQVPDVWSNLINKKSFYCNANLILQRNKEISTITLFFPELSKFLNLSLDGITNNAELEKKLIEKLPVSGHGLNKNGRFVILSIKRKA